MEKPERQTILNDVISAASSQADVLTALEQAAHAFDFSFVTLLIRPTRPDDLLARLLIQTTLPSQFVQEFDQSRLLAVSPLMPLLFSSMLPRTWTLESAETLNPNSIPVELAQLLRRYGMKTAAVMPLHSLEGERFLLQFDGERPPVEQPELNEIGMIALHAFDVFEKLRRAERFTLPGPLSARELEVVRWTAQGKTSVEIGRILSLSDHTVNAHMTNAIKKMDCVNRTQLVAKAIRLGLIN
jgi:DNA-binding CsgD family transcriptional regulator